MGGSDRPLHGGRGLKPLSVAFTMIDLNRPLHGGRGLKLAWAAYYIRAQ